MEREGLGIPQVDRLLSAIPLRSSVVLVNDPGVEAEPFLYQCAHHHLQQGRRVIYAVFNRSPETIVSAMEEYGFGGAAPKGELRFLDAFSALVGGGSDLPGYTLDAPTDLEALAGVLEEIADESPEAVLLLDSLSTLADHASLDAFKAHLPRIHAALKRFRLSVALFTRWPYGEEPAEMLAPFDALLTLKGVEERVMVSQYVRLERAAWAAPGRSRPLLYKALKPGGVLAYVPKVVVTGAHHAGKTTFVHALSDTAVSVNRLGTTVALDHGHLTLDGVAVDVFGTPGQSRFDPLLKTITGQALGVILVVDASRPDTFDRAREMMALTWKQGLPIIVAANKQDLPGALAPQEVARLLEVPAHVQVMGCRAQDKEGSRHVLKALLDQILLGAEAQ
ncbi:MAG TPA: ADP-ribosylation factor-like protein [Candidatus Thermoplasmatota archaeon]|nr:ADP-ribosylation factor-like protein [Candidatus Thermoplasmatota archaeon]